MDKRVIIKDMPRIPRKSPPMIDICTPTKPKCGLEVSPERDGWDTKKLDLMGKAPDAKKRKLE